MANLLEGGRRLAVLGRNVLKISAVFAALAVTLFALAFTDLSLHFTFIAAQGFIFPLIAAFWLAVIGIVLLSAGWVVKGFGSPELGGQRSGDRASNIAAANQ